MNHSEYEKMPKSFDKLNLDEKAFSELGKLKWVVTEKVHGANFSFVYEHRELSCAKRKEPLQWSDDFFGFQAVASAIEENVLGLMEQLSVDVKADKYILYGELYGGSYPHPDVAPDPDVQAIQTGVYYSPSVGFCAFDLAVETDGVKTYMDYEKAIAYFEKFGVFYAQPLFTGKLNEALNFNTRINSAIPAQLGLPELATNMIEGVVVKPYSHSELSTLAFRPVVKLKNPEFDEEQKFHEAEKWSFVPGVTSQSEELSFIVQEISQYINLNRLGSVLSKTGQIDKSDARRMQEIHEEFWRDILFDFNENYPGIIADLNDSQQAWIARRVQARIAGFINESNN